MMETRESEYWDKLIGLIEKAKADPELSERLRHGKPSQVAEILETEGKLTMVDLGHIFDDLGYIADRDSLRWWSPLA
jgi:hypothetical protein